MKLTPALSAYLDCLRFMAALSVLLGHLTQDGFALGWLPLSYTSHEAVVVFFVMSGYIVYMSTAQRQAGAAEYVVARASRLYSVALPAVIVCVLASLAVDQLVPAQAMAGIASWRPFSWADIVASLTFMNESWSATTQVTLNGPYWSLCYEVWYYVLFGLFFFGRGRWRWPLVALAAAVAGPAILVLLPIWVLGAWLAANPQRQPQLSAPAAWALFVGPLVLIGAINASDLDQFVKSWLHNRVPGFWRLEGAQRMFTDYLTGLAIAAHLLAYPSLPAWVHAAFLRSKTLWAALAGFSFTLYLFHRPMTEVAGALLPASAQTVPLALAALALVLLACWLISFATERRLPQWRRMLRRCVPRAAATRALARQAR